eukprot:TRINITY_DN14710_c0_g1_i1.p1 TRINITY_DN14710_c0_g1~~TRINITY_DN14710_c0_g1_i1.p1  ORF type:complete len:556 (-),score=95.15 TRINITY_DN14710_c0_g1_i1:57-1724(-)
MNTNGFSSLLLLLLLLFVMVTTMTTTVEGVPICFNDTGHAYDIISSGVSMYNIWTWSNASDLAANSTFGGCTGYLATATFAREMEFLKNISRTTTAAGAWMGGRNIDSATNTFAWVTGPDAVTVFSHGIATDSSLVCDLYCNYLTGEPNGVDLNAALEVYVSSCQWNDYPSDNRLDGYFVEYGDNTCFPCVSPSTTPSMTASETVSATASMTASETVSAMASVSVISSASAMASATLSVTTTASPTISLSTTTSPSLSPSISLMPSTTTTPTLTISKSKSKAHIVYVATTCRSVHLSECPNHQCKRNVGDCDGDIKIDTEKQIKEVKVPVTDREAEGGLFVGLNSDQNRRYLGDVFFPAGTLKSGWTVYITNTNKKVSSNDHKKKCGKKAKEDSKKIVSSKLDITVKDKNGKEIKLKDIKPPIELSAFADISDNDKSCFAYAEQNDPDFTCLDDHRVNRVNSQLSQVQSTTTHLTSFAVLLLPSASNDDCGSSNIWWILTTSFLAGSFVCCFLVIVLGSTRRFRSVIYGYQKEQDIDSVTDKVSKVMLRRQQTVN